MSHELGLPLTCGMCGMNYSYVHATVFIPPKRSVVIYGQGGGRRENGWVNKILWVEMGRLNKNSPSQGVGKVKIIKSENTKIFVLFVLRSNKYHLLYISIRTFLFSQKLK